MMGGKRKQAELTGLGEQIATKWEQAVILALQELARDWPESVTLVSMDGGLSVVRSDLYHRAYDTEPNGARRQEMCVLASIDGIPNDGGGW
jgi:hypothetical protein